MRRFLKLRTFISRQASLRSNPCLPSLHEDFSPFQKKKKKNNQNFPSNTEIRHVHPHKNKIRKVVAHLKVLRSLRLRYFFVEFRLHCASEFQRLLNVVLFSLLLFFGVDNKVVPVIESKTKQNQDSSKHDREHCSAKHHPLLSEVQYLLSVTLHVCRH